MTMSLAIVCLCPLCSKGGRSDDLSNWRRPRFFAHTCIKEPLLISIPAHRSYIPSKSTHRPLPLPISSVSIQPRPQQPPSLHSYPSQHHTQNASYQTGHGQRCRNGSHARRRPWCPQVLHHRSLCWWCSHSSLSQIRSHSPSSKGIAIVFINRLRVLICCIPFLLFLTSNNIQVYSFVLPSSLLPLILGMADGRSFLGRVRKRFRHNVH